MRIFQEYAHQTGVTKVRVRELDPDEVMPADWTKVKPPSLTQIAGAAVAAPAPGGDATDHAITPALPVRKRRKKATR
jgi:hypothetical protein